MSHIINFRTDCQRKGTFNLRPDAQQDRIEQEMGRIESRGADTIEKRQKNNPNLLALFAFYRYFIIIGSVWGYLYIYHIFTELQNKKLNTSISFTTEEESRGDKSMEASRTIFT